MRKVIFVGALLGLAVHVFGAAQDVVHPGTNEWVKAAKTATADLLILGDSVVYAGGVGWNGGMTAALNKRYGLAGTGLMSGGGGGSEGYDVGPQGDLFSYDPASAPADRLGYEWNQQVATAGSTPVNYVGAWFDSKTIPGNSALDWHVYSASRGKGSMSAYSRDENNYHVYQTLPAVTIDPPAQGGLRETVMHFDATPGVQWRNLRLNGVTNTSIMYQRVSVPSARGVRVTSWGYGGHSTLAFSRDRWNGQGVTPEGRKAWFDALTEDASGKLNVLIAEGLNDRHETSPSIVNNITPSYSPDAFADNISSLIANVRADWKSAGHDLNNLSFTLLGTYDQGETSDDELLHQYSYREAAIAAGDPQISFINAMIHTPSQADAMAMGYLTDGTHPSPEGAMVYSEAVIDALVPEPATPAMLLIIGLVTLRRRRS